MDREVVSLAVCLRSAMRALERAGDIEAVGWMFWGDKADALVAIQRRIPWIAAELDTLTKQTTAQANELAGRWHGTPPTPGRRKGSIVVGDSQFWVDPRGRVIRDGQPTRLRVNAEHHCWVVVDVACVDFRPRRHYVGLGGSAMALYDAALIVTADQAPRPST